MSQAHEHHPDKPEDKLPPAEKVVYGLGITNDIWGNWLYHSLAWPVFNIFLGVGPVIVSSCLMISRLVDAVTDPLFGWLTDNARTRWGRRRPFILVGSILAGLLLPCMFLVGRDWSQSQYFWFMAISSSLLVIAVSCFNMAYQSLGSELTPGYHERTSVFKFKGIIQRIVDLGLYSAAAFTTMKIFIPDGEDEPDVLFGAQIYTLIAGALMIGIGIMLFFKVKERYYNKVVATKQPPIQLLDTYFTALKVQPFRAQLLISLAYGMGNSMIGGIGYILTVYYVCGGNVSEGNMWSFKMGFVNLAGVFIIMPLVNKISNRIGKRQALKWVLSLGVLVYLSTFWLYTPHAPVLQLLASALLSVLHGSFYMLLSSMGVDVVDYDEQHSGKRREGTFVACGTWFAKLGMALGVGLSGLLLELSGYDSGLGANQPEGSLLTLRILFFAIPIVGLALAAIGFWRFRLSESEMHRIRLELEERRGTI
ncbi:MFS transporter [Pelagicoccus mobilis]|uniref:MFS transporter n=1 Tax=Pelagicoccus mobilis TaxID=415221 RepID=A0A934RZM5_9BACT|nr:MFS transporter [Pelagicoccus mobilis]MBK1877816.1 MFS transporter [Pelagicoccus mobilis]